MDLWKAAGITPRIRNYGGRGILARTVTTGTLRKALKRTLPREVKGQLYSILLYRRRNH